MPLNDPLVIVGVAEDGERHLVNVQTSDVGTAGMVFRTICYMCRPSFRHRYPLGISLTRLGRE